MLSLLLQPQILAAYVILALIVALLGRNKQIGFWGFLVLSLLMTPILTGFFMIITRERKIRT
jgi:Na+/melibiose symporter-like transporter